MEEEAFTQKHIDMARALNSILTGHRHSDVIRAFGLCVASMSLHMRANFVDDSIDDLRSAAIAYFNKHKSSALS